MASKIFINFSCKNLPHGGGNQFVQKLVDFLEGLPHFIVTFNLEKNIDLYFLIDLRKNGEFKKYSFDEIYLHKQLNGGTIVYRINDCDITRENKVLEPLILKYITKIDYFIFNSDFIKEYYFGKYIQFSILKNYSIIYNTCDGKIFYPKRERIPTKIKIVTHHWSDNINKGYDIYYQLYKYCQNRNDFEFLFIGRKFNDKFNDPPAIIGPFKGEKLANALRQCDVYISASIYDSCPMHVLEGLSCGLPILYLNHNGGGKEICQLSKDHVGEPFNDFNDLITSLNKIKNNYSFYNKNIKKNCRLYNSEDCYKAYSEIFSTLMPLN